MFDSLIKSFLLDLTRNFSPTFSLSLSIKQGAGLVVLAGCYVAIQQVFTKNVLGDTKQLFITLIGAGRGSMYNVSLLDIDEISRFFILLACTPLASSCFNSPPPASLHQTHRHVLTIARH